MSNTTPSVSHSYVQAKLITALSILNQYSVFSELSIEIEGKEYVPDICIYTEREIDLVHDLIRMTEMPLLAVEILPPRQTIQELVEKIEIYLNAGIQSCWLVSPVPRSITIFHEIKKPRTFGDKMVDEKLNISLSLDEIFPF